MTVSRYYSSTASDTTLTAPITGGSTTMVVAGVTGLPIQYPYTLSIDADEAAKELVTVTAAAGTTLTITRGVDGTSAQSHSLGAVVRHDHSARDFRESREHEDATLAHGATGAVVGTTNTQALTNKDLSSGTNTFPSSLATDAEVTAAVAAEATARTNADNALNTAKQDAATAATLTGAQALTNKDLTSGTNTFPTTLATLTGAQTLTNKTLTDPVINRNSKTTAVPYAVANLAALPTTGVADGDFGATADGKLYQRRAGAWVRADMQAHTCYSLTSNTNCSTGVDKVLTGWTVEDAAVGITVNSGAGTFSPTEAGIYTIAGTIAYVANTVGRRCALIYINGAERVRSAIAATDSGGAFVNVVITVRLAAGDTVSLVANQTSGSTINAATAETHLSIVRVGS